jgi:hypothetical protein
MLRGLGRLLLRGLGLLLLLLLLGLWGLLL